MTKKYRAYRIREDPKTRFRYVTEILNAEEAKQLVNKKWAQILICQKSMIRDPAEDFKEILDEGERKMLAEFDKEEEEEKATEGDKSEAAGSSSSEKKAEDETKPAKKVGQKRVQPNAAAAPGEMMFDEKMTEKFKK